MRAETATYGAGCCGTGVVPSGVWFGAPAAGCWVGALECVVAKLVAVVALCELVEAESPL